MTIEQIIKDEDSVGRLESTIYHQKNVIKESFDNLSVAVAKNTIRLCEERLKTLQS